MIYYHWHNGRNVCVCVCVLSFPSPGHRARESVLFIWMMPRSRAMHLNQRMYRSVLHHVLTEEWEIIPISQVWVFFFFKILRLMHVVDALFFNLLPNAASLHSIEYNLKTPNRRIIRWWWWRMEMKTAAMLLRAWAGWTWVIMSR